MKLSVIIPAYKFVKYIEQSVYSVLFQKTNFEFEVLVRDDFSQDGTDEILKRILLRNPNLKVFESTENWGFYKNIKFLMENCSGEYIAYLDGDDYFTDPCKLQKQVDFLDSNPEYIMSATGYWILKGDSEYIPSEPEHNMCSHLSEVKTEDLFVENYVGFGRVFRNVKNIVKHYMSTLPYMDYALNFELSLLGKIRNEMWPGGVYREHFKGVLTSLSSEDKLKVHFEMKEFLKNKYEKNKMKVLTIVDCYVHNNVVEEKLLNLLIKLKKHNHSILLVTNTIVSESIMSNVDFLLYNKNNNLFTKNYTNVKDITLYKFFDTIKIYEVLSGLQKHGLSVLINLFNSLDLAKSLGFTHFQRLECDDLMGENSMRFVESVPSLCYDSNNKSLFYVNNNDNQSDVSFHYFFSEINFFIDSIHRITNENDYFNYIVSTNKNTDFINVEEFLFKNLESIGFEHVLQKNGSEMFVDFSDTFWNTETSVSNVSEKYKGATSRLYNITNNSESITLLSYNYIEESKSRKIVVTFNDGTSSDFLHNLHHKGFWVYNVIPNTVLYIDVYENDEHLYREFNKDINNYVTF